MKHLFTLCIVLLTTSGLMAQTQVELEIIHRADGQAFAMNQEYQAPGAYPFKVERLEYYLSSIKLVHDGGQVTDVTDTWLLVNAGSASNFDLGSFDVTDLEALRFSVGVEQPINTEDPSLWPTDHPLAPQMPSMHWGWNAGYRFVALEGVAGSGEFTMQLHGLGVNNYVELEMPYSLSAAGGQLNIPVYTNYAGLLTDVDASTGLIVHSETQESQTALLNMTVANRVFTPMINTSVEAVGAGEAQLQLFPNPTVAGQSATLKLDEPADAGTQVTILDVQGRQVWSTKLTAGANELALPTIAAGTYMVQLMQDAQLVATRKWVAVK